MRERPGNNCYIVEPATSRKEGKIMDVEPHNRELLRALSSSDDPFFSSGSELSSPIDSAQSSSSTESSEEGDDYIGELTRQMAQYMLQDEDKHEKVCSVLEIMLTKIRFLL